MKKIKYRDFDYSTNIIITTKVGNYTAYKGTRAPTIKSSIKKIEPINIKMFENPKKNNRIMSKNDRVDLYLEGDQVPPQQRKVSSKSLVSNDKTFYKMCKAKKKADIIASMDPKFRTNWPLPHYEQLTEEDNLNNRSNINIKQMNLRTVSRQLQRKSTENVSKFQKLNFKKVDADTAPNRRKYVSVKNQLRKVCEKDTKESKQINQTIAPKKKPMFYLQPKQINHIKAQSFIVTQYPSGNIIMGNYFKKSAEIASLTKIMTFYTVYLIAEEFSKNLSKQTILIDQEAQEMTGTSAQVFVGDIYTVQQLLYGLMLPSGNDAATALAKWGGSILLQNQTTISQQIDISRSEVKRFVHEMNKRAKKIDLKSTRFGNPHGLPHSQSGSTPQQLSLLIYECLKIDIFREVVATKKYSCWIEDNEGVKRQIIWENTNKLLRRPNFIGVKTGVTVTAGPCLATCYKVQDKIFIIVLLRTNKLSRRFKETRSILGIALNKLDKKKYEGDVKRILKNDIELDSDNSEDEEQFNYDRSDAKEIAKRNKILTFQI